MFRAEGISKKIGDFQLKGISFSLADREILSIIGPSGAGKSSIVKIITGIIRAEGKLVLDGEDISKFPPEKRNIGYIPQNIGLFPHLDVRENIEYPLKRRKFPRKEREKLIKEFSNEFGISRLLHRSPLTLSGGEKQKVALVRALIYGPKLLLMDEPLSSVDSQKKEFYLNLIKEIKKRFEVSIIYVTHNFDEAITISDKIVVLKGGKIIRRGIPQELIENPEDLWIASFVKEKNIFKGSFKDGIFCAENSELCFHTPFKKNGEGFLSLRADEIIISKDRFDSSALNVFKGKVKEIVDLNYNCQINAEVKGLIFKVIITKKSLARLKLNLEEEIFLHFKANSLKELKDNF